MVFVAPGVYVRELDYSLYAPALSTTIFGAVTTARWGKMNSPIFLSSVPNALNNLGQPSPDHYGMYGIHTYLKRGTMAWAVRVEDGTAERADTGDDVLGTNTPAFIQSGNSQPFIMSAADVARLESAEVPPYIIAAATPNNLMKIKVVRGGTEEVVEDIVIPDGTYNMTIGDPNYIVDVLNGLFSGNLEFYRTDGGFLGVRTVGTYYGPTTTLRFYGTIGDAYHQCYDTFFDVAAWTYADSDLDGNYQEITGAAGNNQLTVRLGDITGGPYPGVFTDYLVTFGTPGVLNQSFTAAQLASAVNTAIGIAGTASSTGGGNLRVTHANGGTSYYVEITTAGTTCNSILGFTLDTPSYGTGPSSACMRFYGLWKGTEGNEISLRISDAYKKTFGTGGGYPGYENSFKITVYVRGVATESYDNLLAWDGIGTAPADWYVTRIGTPDPLGEPQDSQISKIIMVENLTAAYPTYTGSVTYTLGTGTGNAGTDGNDSPDPDDLIAAYIAGIEILKTPASIDVNLISCAGQYTDAIFLKMIETCETRGDAMCLIDTPPALDTQEVVAWHNGLPGSGNTVPINSSYAAIYWPWVKVYDQYSKDYIWLPPSGHAAQVYAYTDFISEVWFAPAGFNRGHLIDVIDTEYVSLTQGDLELLYGNQNRINPIVKFIPDGFTIWGQKTAQVAPTARDRVNVRRLLLYARKVVSTAVKYLVFEPNDAYTWRWFIRLTSPIFETIKARRGVYDFRIICDETTNTPDLINQSTMRGVIYMKPTKAAEIIVVDFVLLETGASFEEIIGQTTAA